MAWTVESPSETVDEELRARPAEIRARFVRTCGLIAAVGLERVGAPHVKHLTGALWEMGMTGRDRVITSALCHRAGQVGRGRAGVCQKAAADAEA